MASQTEYIYNKPTNIDNCKKWYQPEYHETMADWWPLHKDFKWRDDDVIVCTFPRSGTHLIGNMAMMIVTQDVQKTLEHPFENMSINWFCYKDDQDGRRALTSHLIPFDFGDDTILNGNRKFIHVIRNPKSTCVSFYHLLKNMPGMLVDPGSFDSYALSYAEEEPSAVDRDWVTHTRAFEEYIDRHPTAPIMQIHFNDVTRDMEGTVKKIADFLNVKLSIDKIKEIVDGCSFENMKKGCVSSEMKDLGKDGSKPEFYRKGQRDDWKKHFTVALNERFDSAITIRMQGSKTPIVLN